MPDSIFGLDGTVAFITGGSKGLGKEMALALARAGADVAIGSRKEEQITQAAQALIEQTRRTILPLVVDVTDRASIKQAVGKTIDRFGKIDILVNNAGINIREPVEQIEDAHWRQIWETNVTGVLSCCRAVIPHMRKARYGRIINIGSALSLVGMEERASYCASKGAVMQLTRTLALEVAQDGITVNCICPGPFATEINQAVMEDPEKTRTLLSNVPMNRWGRLEEIHAPIVFLASPAASYVTGACLTVDGGWTAR
ncbi:MAG: glucose 1-dehydrogenase [Sedimentisphaerales bacterium]|nr:glucose 1-dehydrogenase [Sedimentisphaerales bacterium]